MAEIVPVTSEALESQVRSLLPSQRGFGEDLQASNVITPVIDLTAAAQGTTTPEILQTALAFGSQTSTTIQNSSATLINTTGFFRVYGTWSLRADGGGDRNVAITITDGLSTKNLLYGYAHFSTSTDYNEQIFDFIVFLRAGDSVGGSSNSSDARMDVTTRQIADINGNLVNPVGFTPQ